MKKDRSKEYEILGRILVDFETLISQIKWKLCEQMMYLGLDYLDKGQRPFDIILSKMSADQSIEKFRSIHTELFSQEHELTSKVEIFTKCVGKLIEIRNLFIHAEWYIGYSEFTGTEEPTSRGFNDRYGKNGLRRYRIYFNLTTFRRIDKCIKQLTTFISGIEIMTDKIQVSNESKRISETKLKEIFSFFNDLIEKCDVV